MAIVIVVLEPWVGAPSTIPAVRDAQLSALSLPNTDYASMTDLGDPDAPFGSVQ